MPILTLHARKDLRDFSATVCRFLGRRRGTPTARRQCMSTARNLVWMTFTSSLLVGACASSSDVHEDTGGGSESAFTSSGEKSTRCVDDFAKWRKNHDAIATSEMTDLEKGVVTAISWRTATTLMLSCVSNGAASSVPRDVANELRNRVPQQCAETKAQIERDRGEAENDPQITGSLRQSAIDGAKAKLADADRSCKATEDALAKTPR
jgi:hypothetical protein